MKYLLVFSFLLSAAFAVAYTHADKAPKTALYWFQLDVAGNQIEQTTVPVATQASPYGCAGSGPYYCERGYSQYEMVPGASPARYRGKAGTGVITHYSY